MRRIFLLTASMSLGVSTTMAPVRAQETRAVVKGYVLEFKCGT